AVNAGLAEVVDHFIQGHTVVFVITGLRRGDRRKRQGAINNIIGQLFEVCGIAHICRGCGLLRATTNKQYEEADGWKSLHSRLFLSLSSACSPPGTQRIRPAIATAEAAAIDQHSQWHRRAEHMAAGIRQSNSAA